MTDHTLDGHRSVFRSRMGAFFPGSHVIFRGRDLHRELIDTDWLALCFFAVTGRTLTKTQIELIHAIWVCTSYPDARIWNNRVAALAGSTRSTANLGVAAAVAVSEAHIYGRGVDLRAIDFLMDTRERVTRGEVLIDCIRRELDRYRRIAGYGRPLINGDERIAPIMELARRLGMDNGPHVRLAFEVENTLCEGGWRMRMNYAAIAAALMADIGMSPQEYSTFLTPCFIAGMYPCFIEAMEKPSGATFPFACDQLQYSGVGKRSWPDKSKKVG
jgi:hypothetical protein